MNAAVFRDDSLGCFAVLENFVVTPGREMASDVVIRNLRSAFSRASGVPLSPLMEGLQQAHLELSIDGSKRSTSVTAVQVTGGRVAFVTVGDCRLYIKRNRGALSRITHDETNGNYPNHVVGWSLDTDESFTIRQKGLLRTEPGDTFVLLTRAIYQEGKMGVQSTDDLDDLLRAELERDPVSALMDSAVLDIDRAAIVLRF